MFESPIDYIGGCVGSICLAVVGTDILSGSQPPWWAQFGAGIMISVVVIILMIKYLIPKLDNIQIQQTVMTSKLDNVDDTLADALKKQIVIEERVMTLLEKLINDK